MTDEHAAMLLGHISRNVDGVMAVSRDEHAELRRRGLILPNFTITAQGEALMKAHPEQVRA